MLNYISRASRALRSLAPFMLYMAVAAVSCFAAASPLSKLLTDLSGEATSTWATAGAGIGLVLGLLGLKFGNRDHKGAMATMVVVSFALLSVQGIIAYLQGE